MTETTNPRLAAFDAAQKAWFDESCVHCHCSAPTGNRTYYDEDANEVVRCDHEYTCRCYPCDCDCHDDVCVAYAALTPADRAERTEAYRRGLERVIAMFEQTGAQTLGELDEHLKSEGAPVMYFGPHRAAE
jgi:hypothetical protein